MKAVSPGAGGRPPERPACPRCGSFALPDPRRLEELASRTPAPASLRAGAPLLLRRLARCFACDSLREQVICAHCGCFVRFRAAVLKSWCPSPSGDKWAFPEKGRAGDS
jgi:hypothetical protein